MVVKRRTYNSKWHLNTIENWIGYRKQYDILGPITEYIIPFVSYACFAPLWCRSWYCWFLCFGEIWSNIVFFRVPQMQYCGCSCSCHVNTKTLRNETIYQAGETQDGLQQRCILWCWIVHWFIHWFVHWFWWHKWFKWWWHCIWKGPSRHLCSTVAVHACSGFKQVEI